MSNLPHESQTDPPHRLCTARLTYSLVAIGVVLTLGYLLTPAHAYFRLFNDEASFNRVLSQQVPSGVTLESIQALLGPATPNHRAGSPEALKSNS